MTIVDMAIIALMALCVVIGVGEPLVRQAWARTPEPGDHQETAQLLLHKEMVYGAIRDLDFDFQTHKVDQADYTALRQQLENEAVELLRKLDAVDPHLGLESAIEQQVQALRQQVRTPSGEGEALLCPDCHFQYAPDANFCPVCSHPVR